MAEFWNKETPNVSLILFGIVDICLFVAATDDTRFGYWPPVILLVAILLTILNNVRIRRQTQPLNLSDKDRDKAP
ncbi:hypothetical protein GCM10023346_47890 [Arthrobacter gyeryongensis]|uniref:Uncharacterized protein n=1 Tax=Arthrobacter gyeryongensis TaxID=1650592 RepID=A0ABP9SV04_9MICC